MSFQQKVNNTYTNPPKFNQSDINYLSYIRRLYGDVLSSRGVNILDPIYTNMFYYNKTQNNSLMDIPRVTRTHVFITRPELNFSFENLNAIPFFKWLYSKPIGKMIFSLLTDPNYFINAPSALNSIGAFSYDHLKGIIDTFRRAVEGQNTNINETAGVNDSLEEMEQNISNNSANNLDDQAKVNELNSLNIDSIAEDTAFEQIIKDGSISKLSSQYKAFNRSYEQMVNTYRDKYTMLNENLNRNANVDIGQGAGLHIYQAKNILKATHNSLYDNFNFTSPFIPLLQNTCVSLTGSKDLNLETTNFDPDEFGSDYSLPTGMDEVFGGGELTLVFDDIAYGPVSLLMMVWVMYIHYVSRGYISTTREHVIERILDYTCSIYCFVIGANGRSIERFGKFTGAFPTTFPLSQQLEHNTSFDPEMLKKIQINFKYNAYEFMDPQIFTDFNFVSETEWLFKLKNWDSLYDRKTSLGEMALLNDFIDGADKNTPFQKSLLRAAGRNPAIWNVVSELDMGMSGKMPRALVDGSVIDLEKDLSRSDLINNFWGGYPYINNASELIWVSPKWRNTTFDSLNSTSKSINF